MTASSKSIAGLVAEWQNIAATSRGAGAGSTRSSRGGGLDPPSGTGFESFVPEDDPRNLLVEMLVAAAQLEFATIPPYLCALWSIEDELDPAAESIREVVQEEMLHLALVCNLLAALGERPRLLEWAPQYPTPLPGDVHIGLEVKLQGLNKAALADFIRIESPEKLPDNVEREQEDPHWEGGRTIGALYDSILAAFRHLRPELKTEFQVTGPLSWRSIATLTDVEWAIQTIQHQGEGAVLGPLDSSRSDLAHYYRFLELWKEKRLKFEKSERHFYWRGKLPFPKCRPMAPVPNGGYGRELSPNVAQHLKQFDKAYEGMLIELENAWSETAGQGALIRAYALMFELGKHARPLMNIHISGTTGPTYGPLFTPPQLPRLSNSPAQGAGP